MLRALIVASRLGMKKEMHMLLKEKCKNECIYQGNGDVR